jgi:hypothetical protein
LRLCVKFANYTGGLNKINRNNKTPLRGPCCGREEEEKKEKEKKCVT